MNLDIMFPHFQKSLYLLILKLIALKLFLTLCQGKSFCFFSALSVHDIEQ